MNLIEMRNEDGSLSAIIIPAEDIAELKNNLKVESTLFDDLNTVLKAEEESVISKLKLTNGLTIEETQAKTLVTTEKLYKDAFSKGIALYYRDERSMPPDEFIRANPDGSEDLVSFDLSDRSYSLIRKLLPAGKGRWGYLL